MKGLVSIDPIVTPDQLQRLMAAAAADNHRPLYPTHTVTRDGEVTGSLSVLGIPLVTFWSHSQLMTARATFDVINIAKNLGFRQSNGKPVVTLCPMNSPIYPYLPGMGFNPFLTTTLLLQEVK